MKKNLLIGLAAIASWFATSCQNEIDSVSEGNTSVVSFNVGTSGIASRAFSNGETAKKLEYAVYKVEDGKLTELEDLTVEDDDALEMINLKKHIELKLTTGNQYAMIFWAAAENAPYAVDFGTKTMTVEYNRAVTNDEVRDAFYAYVEPFTVNGAETKNIELKRPFAQLNIGTNDYEASTKAGYTVTQSYVKVPVYNTLNMVDGTVDGPKTIEFNWANIPSGETFPVTGYEYLAMNYLLVRADKQVVDVEFKYTNGTDEKTRTVGSVPVQRNYRTNIYGQLITSDVDVNVEIKPEYEKPDNDVNNLVFNATELQAALDAAQEGETIIYIAKDIVGDVTDVQKPGRKVVIEGGKNKYNGTIKVHSNSYYYADAALTIKNVNFETSAEGINFIEALENGSERYSNNITVENCTFTATYDAVNTSVGIQVKATRGVTVKNCTATNMHSLIQAQSCDTGDVKVVNCKVKGKNGVAFKQVKSATVEGTTITATAYGIRFDGNIDNYGIIVKNNEVTAVQPFIVRKMTGANNTIALEGTNTLNTGAEYQIVITNGSDDEEYVKPTGTYELTGADEFNVFPSPFKVATWDEFTAALAAGEDWIKLTENIEYSSNYQLQKDVVIDLNGKSMTLPMINIHKTVTIKNGTINGKMYARTGCKATLEGLTFSGTISDDLSTEGHLQVQGGCDVYAKNCTFAATTVNGSQTRSLSIEGSSSGIRKFEGCDFKFLSWGTGPGMYKKNVYINTMNGTTTVDFTNCKFNGKAPNILFAGTYSLTNLSMSGCDNTGPTLETNRAKDAVTEVEWAHISSLIANNKFTKVRLFYAGGSSEYIE